MGRPRRIEKTATAKTTLRLSEPLWHAVRVRAAVERINLRDLVARALEMYLKTPGALVVHEALGKYLASRTRPKPQRATK